MSIIISPDHHLYTPEGRYHWSPERVKAAWGKANAALKEAVADGARSKVMLMGGIPAAGKSTWLDENACHGVIYFDACFTNAFGRSKTIEIIRSVSSEIEIEIVFLNTPVDVCRKRNAERSEDRRVPAEAIDRMADALERDGFPCISEGFSAVDVLFI